MLTGESRTAAQALEAGIIDAVVPADDLLNEARGRALRLAGRRALARWDGPQWRAPEAGALDTKSQVEDFVESLGIGAEERRLYPAYDAILGCVMGGWKLPMTEAGHWEMDRFVDLIQDPVAGNMIRALFLDRQRAAKATAGAAQRAPRARVIGARAVEVAATLRAARVAVAERDESDAGVTIATSAADDGATTATGTPPATRERSTVAWLRGSLQPPLTFGAAVGVWVGDANPLGRAVEVCLEPGADETLGLDVARWLRATALVTRGPSLLQRLEAAAAAASSYSVDEKLLAVALEAARAWIAGGVLDLGIADSVVVTAGVHPAHTGGPFNYLKQRGATAITEDARRSSVRHGAGFRGSGRLGRAMDLSRARGLSMAIDRQFIGYRMTPFEVVVDAERVQRFSEAIGAPTDTLTPGVAAPTFLKVVEGEGNSSRRLLEVLGVDLKRVVHAEQEFEFGSPVGAGDRLTVERGVSDIYDRKDGSLEFVIVDSTIRSVSGQWVGRSLQSLLIRSPGAVTSP